MASMIYGPTLIPYATLYKDDRSSLHLNGLCLYKCSCLEVKVRVCPYIVSIQSPSLSNIRLEVCGKGTDIFHYASPSSVLRLREYFIE